MDLARNSIIAFGGRAVSYALMALGSLLLARLLGPQARGEYALLNSSTSIAAMLLTFGLGTSNAVLASRRQIPANTLFLHSLLWGTLAGGLFLAVLWHWAPAFASLFLGDSPAAHVRLMACAVPFYILFNCLLGLAQGLQRFALYSQANILRALLFLVSFLALFWLGWREVAAGLWAFVISFAAAALLLLVLLFPARREKLSWDASAFEQQLGFGWKIYLAELFTFLLYRLDLVLVGYFWEATQAGFYSIIGLFAESLWFLAGSVGVVLLPSSGARQPGEMRVLAPRAVRLVFLLTSLCVSLLWQIDHLVVQAVFGERFLPAVLPLHLSYLGIVAMSLTKVIASYALGCGQAQWNTTVSCLGLFSNLALNLWMIPRWGAAGAALAMSLSYSLMAILMVGWFRRFAGVTLHMMFILQTDDWRYGREKLEWVFNQLAAK
ncbi:MAG: oligosaccharide flippase family protein [candidate division KSB1 bacterium]|nr:oligosaccharide flippase family protein [candidate division KSB1 bacterium]MDZ7275511.1 oligosaccharide flippase family protein [candidate division KSB1 bacterium]MDZ7286177.1 oligosaccharide flippase family protein [candidate division KSB1 bacterium]MDZ7296403.1 oligosaccharide flippase family protein [candidate division KSB1 bacterium]MDZ7306238.1 oligosaccharide flippase family protein [candidate division KSB1 bacterium]